MKWFEVEEDMALTLLWASVPAIFVAMSAFLLWGLLDALMTLVVVGGLAGLTRRFVLGLRLPLDVRDASSIALNAFKAKYSDEEVSSVAVRAVEADRYVFSIRYGMGRPTPRRYFSVSRKGATVEEIDRAKWWPKGLK